MIYQILTAISAFISLLLTIYAFNMKHTKNTVIFAMLMLQITIYTWGTFLELSVKGNSLKIFFYNISYADLLLTIPTLLILIIVSIGKVNSLKPITIVLIYIFPVIGAVLRITGRYSHRMLEIFFIKNGWIVFGGTPFVWLICLFEIANILLTIVLLLSFYNKINRKSKRLVITMAAGIIIPYITFILNIIKPGSKFNLSLVSISFAILGVLVFGCIYRSQIFSVIPLARDKIIDYVQEGIITIDDSGTIVDKNSAADKIITDIYGTSINLLGKKQEELLKAWPRWYLSCKNIWQDEFEIETKTRGKVKYYYVKVYPITINNLKKAGTVSVFIDITERKIQEEKFLMLTDIDRQQIERLTEELGSQEKRMETVLNTVPDNVYLAVSDRDGKYIHHSTTWNDMVFNKEYEYNNNILGIYRKGLYFNKEGKEINAHDLPVCRVLRGEKICNYHFVMKRQGRNRNLVFNGTPIYDKDGNLTYGVYFILDITDQILHKNLLTVTKHLAEMNAFKDKLFTVFTHDIRSPMATMVSLVDLLEEDNNWNSDECTEILSEVKKQVNYTYNIIENLLEWLNSQRDGLVFTPAVWNLTELIEEAISLYLVSAGVKGIQITMKMDKRIEIYTDKEMLELVLRNLLSNAIKFTKQGGYIIVEAYKIDGELIIAVKDTGIGMNEEKVKNLFHEGYSSSTLGTAGEKGIGLGLLICKEFILKGGGKIWAESKPGKGSIFYISLLTANKNER